MKTRIYLLAICCLFLSSVSAQKSNKKKSKAVAEVATPVLSSGKALYFKNDPAMGIAKRASGYCSQLPELTLPIASIYLFQCTDCLTYRIAIGKNIGY